MLDDVSSKEAVDLFWQVVGRANFALHSLNCITRAREADLERIDPVSGMTQLPNGSPPKADTEACWPVGRHIRHSSRSRPMKTFQRSGSASPVRSVAARCCCGVHPR